MELVADGISEFLARRHVAEAVAGHEDFNLRQHFEHDRHADLELKHIVADVCTGYADGRDHGLDRIGDDGLIRDGEQNVLIHGHDAPADVLAAIRVREENVDRHVDLAAHAGKTRPVAQALDREVADRSLSGCGAAALKCNGHGRLGTSVFCRLARRAAAGDQTVADERHALLAELLLLQAAVVDALHLNADLFIQAIENFIAAQRAGAVGGIAVLVGVKTHSARLPEPVCFLRPDAS